MFDILLVHERVKEMKSLYTICQRHKQYRLLPTGGAVESPSRTIDQDCFLTSLINLCCVLGVITGHLPAYCNHLKFLHLYIVGL